MTAQLGKSRVVLLSLLIGASGQFAGRCTAFGQAQQKVIASQQPAATSSISTQGYNQRLQELAQSSSSAGSGAASADYRIGAEDLLEISVYGAPDLDRTTRVSADGWISVPLAGDVRAEGLTTRELEAQIERLLQKNYMTHPQVNVFLKEIQSHSISVFGAVGKPGVFEIRGAKSLIEVLSMAQGLADDAGDSVIVMRQAEASAGLNVAGAHPSNPAGAPAKPQPSAPQAGNGGEDIEVHLKDLLASTDSSNNVMVYPGDVVKVPPAGIVYVVGQVRKPGGFLLKTNQSLSVLQALALAEGTTSTSSGKSARIIRTQGKDGQRQEIPINLNRILAGKAPDPVLQGKDILFVPNSAGKTALYRGAEAAVTITGGLIVYRSW